MRLQEHMLYRRGFEEAAELEPLFPGADPIYQAGWEGYWRARQIVEHLNDVELCEFPVPVGNEPVYCIHCGQEGRF